jgi:haloalkane dehalogenase
MSPDVHDWRQLYAFDSHRLDLDGGRYHYVDEGRGAPLVMVHGNPTWSFYWRHLVDGLKDQNRTVVPDHMGCGLSDKPQRYPYSLAQHTANLVKLIDHLQLESATLVVHDWGGPIGLGAALQRPERFSRLVIFNTGAFPPPFVPLRIRVCRTPLLGTFALRGLNLFARAALRMATNHPQRMTPPVKAGLLAPYDSWRNRVAISGFVRDIPMTRWHPTWGTLAQLERQLPSLADRPVQIIWGMRDWCFKPLCLDRLLETFRTAEVHRLEDAGHYVVEDAHERIVPLVRDFLKKR